MTGPNVVGVRVRCEVEAKVTSRTTCWDCVHGLGGPNVFCTVDGEYVQDEIIQASLCDFYDREEVDIE